MFFHLLTFNKLNYIGNNVGAVTEIKHITQPNVTHNKYDSYDTVLLTNYIYIDEEYLHSLVEFEQNTAIFQRRI